MSIKSTIGSYKSISGFKHWVLQKLLACALIPLLIWAQIWFLGLFTNNNSINDILANDWKIILFIVFFSFALWHAILGIESIVTDYIKSVYMRIFIIYSLKFINILTIIILAISMLRLNMLVSLLSIFGK